MAASELAHVTSAAIHALTQGPAGSGVYVLSGLDADNKMGLVAGSGRRKGRPNKAGPRERGRQTSGD